MKIPNSLFKIPFARWTIPLGLLGLCILAFGLLIPRLGFYWDDWAKILVAKVYGLSGYWQYYAEDRPLSAWTHILLTPILGVSPTGWHIFTLLMRWLSSWGLYWCVSMIWPRRYFEAVMAACLFLVYPEFTQQSAAVTFHQQWLQYALLFLSLGFMILSFQKVKYFWGFTFLSILTNLIQLSVTEYFIGWELLRPLIIWLVVRHQGQEKSLHLRRTLMGYLPYGIVFIGYVLYRMFFIQLAGSDPYRAETLYQLVNDPGGTLIWLARTIFVDVSQILFFSWSEVLNVTTSENLPPFTWISILVGFAGAIGLIVYLMGLPRQAPEENDRIQFPWEMTLLGMAALLFGPLSAWATGRQVLFDFHSNRYALPAIFGASLLWVSLLSFIAEHRFQRVLVLALVVAIATSFHLRTANTYR